MSEHRQRWQLALGDVAREPKTATRYRPIFYDCCQKGDVRDAVLANDPFKLLHALLLLNDGALKLLLYTFV